MNRTSAILAGALAVSVSIIGLNAANGSGKAQPTAAGADKASATRIVTAVNGSAKPSQARITTYVVPPTSTATSITVKLPRIKPGDYHVQLTAILADAEDSGVCYFDKPPSYTALSYGTYVSGYSVGHSSGFFRAKAGGHYAIECFANSGDFSFSGGGDTSTVTLTRLDDRKIVGLNAPDLPKRDAHGSNGASRR